LVGTSVGRRVSKRAGLVGNPSDRGESAGECAVLFLSAETWEVQGTVDAASLGREIYDLIPIEGVRDWSLVPDTEWQAETLRALWKSVDESAALAQTAQGELREEKRRAAEADRRAAEAEREAQEGPRVLPPALDGGADDASPRATRPAAPGPPATKPGPHG
jgi:hypothetical protein